MSTDPREDNVCVACKCSTDNVMCFGEKGEPDPLCYHVCQECYRDGTFQDWLAKELERVLDEAGTPFRIDEQGRKLYTGEPPTP